MNTINYKIYLQTSLFSSGSDSLNREFKDLLLRHSKPMLPVALLNIINMDEGILKPWFIMLFINHTQLYI